MEQPWNSDSDDFSPKDDLTHGWEGKPPDEAPMSFLEWVGFALSLVGIWCMFYFGGFLA